MQKIIINTNMLIMSHLFITPTLFDNVYFSYSEECKWCVLIAMKKCTLFE